MSEQSEQINAMLAAFEVDDNDESVGNEETEEENVENKEETSEEQPNDEQQEEEETTEEPETEDEETDEEPAEEEPPNDEIAELKKRIAELENERKKVEKEEEKTSKEEPSQMVEIGEEEFEEILEDRKKFNTFLGKFAESIRQKATSETLRSIPDVVRHNMQVMNQLHAERDRFYNENKDLQPFKKVVAQVFEEIASDNPDKQYNELLELTGKEARKRLDLKKKAVEKKEKKEKKTTEQDKKPTLPKKRKSPGRPGDQPEKSSLERELEEMNKVLMEE